MGNEIVEIVIMITVVVVGGIINYKKLKKRIERKDVSRETIRNDDILAVMEKLEIIMDRNGESLQDKYDKQSILNQIKNKDTTCQKCKSYFNWHSQQINRIKTYENCGDCLYNHKLKQENGL